VIGNFDPNCVINADQSSFQRMMPSGRTLTHKGEQKTEAHISNLPGLTHSYTVHYTTSMERLLLKLYICLQEINGEFGPRVIQDIFTADNLVVSCSQSGKETKSHVLDFNSRVLLECMDSDFVYFLDSWPGQKDNALFNCFNESTVRCTKLVIPPKTTSLCQPLDCGFFRPLKSIVRRFYDTIANSDLAIQMHQRNNILKLHSLIHHQLFHPRFNSLIKYAWYVSGYLDNFEGVKPDVNKTLFTFNSSNCIRCDSNSFINCAWCNESLCINHFFIQFHNHFDEISNYEGIEQHDNNEDDEETDEEPMEM